MFKDRNEELRRLEEELLLEEETFPKEEPEQAYWEEDPEEEDSYLDDPEDYGEETEETYYNYNNSYGQFPVYNSDVTDADLEQYSEQVYKGKKRKGGCALVAFTAILISVVVTVLLWYSLRFLGVLG